MNVTSAMSYRRTVTLVIVVALIGMTFGVGTTIAQETSDVGEETEVIGESTAGEAVVEESVNEESSQETTDEQEIVESEETATGPDAADLVDVEDAFAADDVTDDVTDDLLDDDFLTGGLFE